LLRIFVDREKFDILVLTHGGKSNMVNNTREKRWHWLIILLWAYSILGVSIIVVVSIFFTSSTVSTPISATDSIINGILFIPLLVFLLIIGRNNLKN